MSQILTNYLDIKDLPPVDPDDDNVEETLQEWKESMVTAKVEAIAANTMANTQAMPNWISVKLGFQHYRFLIFSRVQEYFISLLAEGNLDFKEPIINEIKNQLGNVINHPFIGDLAPFKSIEKIIADNLKKAQVGM